MFGDILRIIAEYRPIRRKYTSSKKEIYSIYGMPQKLREQIFNSIKSAIKISEYHITHKTYKYTDNLYRTDLWAFPLNGPFKVLKNGQELKGSIIFDLERFISRCEVKDSIYKEPDPIDIDEYIENEWEKTLK